MVKVIYALYKTLLAHVLERIKQPTDIAIPHTDGISGLGPTLPDT